MTPEMQRRLPWIGSGLVVLIIGIVAMAPKCGMSPPAPGFTQTIEAGEGVGDRVALDSLEGKIVVLDFWASWCRPCRRSIPILNRLYGNYDDGRVLFYGVNVEPSTPQVLQTRHATLEAHFPTFHDPDGDLQARYGVQGLPTLVVVDGAGRLRHTSVGIPDEEDLSNLFDELLQPNP